MGEDFLRVALSRQSPKGQEKRRSPSTSSLSEWRKKGGRGGGENVLGAASYEGKMGEGKKKRGLDRSLSRRRKGEDVNIRGLDGKGNLQLRQEGRIHLSTLIFRGKKKKRGKFTLNVKKRIGAASL